MSDSDSDWPTSDEEDGVPQRSPVTAPPSAPSQPSPSVAAAAPSPGPAPVAVQKPKSEVVLAFPAMLTLNGTQVVTLSTTLFNPEDSFFTFLFINQAQQSLMLESSLKNPAKAGEREFTANLSFKLSLTEAEGRSGTLTDRQGKKWGIVFQSVNDANRYVTLCTMAAFLMNETLLSANSRTSFAQTGILLESDQGKSFKKNYCKVNCTAWLLNHTQPGQLYGGVEEMKGTFASMVVDGNPAPVAGTCVFSGLVEGMS